nr:unnamed protein product [Digitaria exilis]
MCLVARWAKLRGVGSKASDDTMPHATVDSLVTALLRAPKYAKIFSISGHVSQGEQNRNEFY